MTDAAALGLPGGQTARVPMHFFWLLDGSSSMAGQKIQSLNFAVGEAIPPIRRTAENVAGLRLLVRALRFATDVDWIVREPTPIAELQWHDIVADGDTATGKAINAVVDELDKIDRRHRFYPPVLVLVTDGRNTDGKLYNSALHRLATHPVGQKAQRYAVAIGSDASIEELQAFIGDDKTPVFEAKNGDQLADFLKFVSVSSIKVSSQPIKQQADAILEDMAAQAKAAKGQSNPNSWVF
jgi:uncharacterized protein YegL